MPKMPIESSGSSPEQYKIIQGKIKEYYIEREKSKKMKYLGRKVYLSISESGLQVKSLNLFQRFAKKFFGAYKNYITPKYIGKSFTEPSTTLKGSPIKLDWSKLIEKTGDEFKKLLSAEKSEASQPSQQLKQPVKEAEHTATISPSELKDLREGIKVFEESGMYYVRTIVSGIMDEKKAKELLKTLLEEKIGIEIENISIGDIETGEKIIEIPFEQLDAARIIQNVEPENFYQPALNISQKLENAGIENPWRVNIPKSEIFREINPDEDDVDKEKQNLIDRVKQGIGLDVDKKNIEEEIKNDSKNYLTYKLNNNELTRIAENPDPKDFYPKVDTEKLNNRLEGLFNSWKQWKDWDFERTEP